MSCRLPNYWFPNFLVNIAQEDVADLQIDSDEERDDTIDVAELKFVIACTVYHFNKLIQLCLSEIFACKNRLLQLSENSSFKES